MQDEGEKRVGDDDGMDDLEVMPVLVRERPRRRPPMTALPDLSVEELTTGENDGYTKRDREVPWHTSGRV